ncbi:MAG: alpha/beta hydrolase [Treponema sp.]|nr:alpha/beta hydrolase [Treponema sp.]
MNTKEFFLNTQQNLPLMIICPGGGYEHLSVREADPVAHKFNSLGFHCVILHYSLCPSVFPTALLELCQIIKYYRQNADTFFIDKNKICLCGFSAGGHLCASCGCFWNASFITEKMQCNSELYKPNMLLLSYPVISAGEFAHKGSFCNLFNIKHEDFQSSIFQNVSLEFHISQTVPPVFIWHTLADDSVPAENSMLFALELKRHNVPFELHLFLEGKHGISLATKETSRDGGVDIVKECQVWPNLFLNFFNTYYKEI